MLLDYPMADVSILKSALTPSALRCKQESHDIAYKIRGPSLSSNGASQSSDDSSSKPVFEPREVPHFTRLVSPLLDHVTGTFKCMHIFKSACILAFDAELFPVHHLSRCPSPAPISF